MKLVIIESPFGKVPDEENGMTGQWRQATPEELAFNIEYAQRCMEDSLKRGEAPYASHLLYPQCLDDATPEERRMGMDAGHAWRQKADLVAVYADRGITPGVQEGINRSKEWGITVEVRHIEPCFAHLPDECRLGPWLFTAHVEVPADRQWEAKEPVVEAGQKRYRIVLNIEYDSDGDIDGFYGEFETMWHASLEDAAKSAEMLSNLAVTWMQFNETLNENEKQMGVLEVHVLVAKAVAEYERVVEEKSTPANAS